MELNDEIASSFCCTLTLPPFFCTDRVSSGDEQICREAVHMFPILRRCRLLAGIGSATVSISPKLADTRIREGVSAALKGDLERCRLKLPQRFKLQITYATP